MNKNVRYNGYILYEWQVKKKMCFKTVYELQKWK